MNNFKFTAILFIVIINSCSTSKNTKTTRAYHNLTSHYNVYFNGNESLKEGLRKVEKNYIEDYSKLLPVFRYEDKAIASMVASEMDRTIKKCAKTIKTHSITTKPEVKSKDISREEQAYLAKPEYCSWIDDAYLLMAKAHFFKREFETAKQTFLLVINKYKEPDTKDEALLWLAKTYAEENDFKNAEIVLVDLRKTRKYDKEYVLQMNLLQASMFLKQKDYTNASNKLKKAIEVEKDKKEKTRHMFILGQIYLLNFKYKLAENYFNLVIKKKPSYEMSFMAQIYLAEIFEKKGGDTKELKKRLKKMAADDKNIDFLDQIYYALGKIELSEQNKEKAIEYFRLSSQAKSSNPSQKVKTYLALADFYYDSNHFLSAEPYYDSTENSMESSYPDYERIFPIVKNRNDLTGELNTVTKEDSLQFLAKMPEKDRNKIIDKKIAEIVKLEQEKKQAEQLNTFNPAFDNISRTRTNPMQGGKFYFYNPSTVSLGQTEFKKKWGDRKLADNWRRKNKQVMLEESALEENTADTDSAGTDSERVTDIKSREYYLQDIPLTEELLEASNKNIEKAIFNSGNIYYRRMNEPEKAVKQFELLLRRFPETKYRIETLYLLYQINNQQSNYSAADKYKKQIIKEYPESNYAKVLQDPNYAKKLDEQSKQLESLYEKAYLKYKNKEYAQVIESSNSTLKQYPGNQLEPQFIYLTAMAYGSMGNKQEMKNNLELLVLQFPEEEVALAAKETLAAMDTKKYEEELYKDTKDSPHFYALIIPKGKTDLNKLKFKFISLNAEHFTQEDLDISIQELDEAREMITIKSFNGLNKAMEYYQLVILNSVLSDVKKFVPTHFVISDINFETFVKNKDEAKYLKFFRKISI